MGCCSGDDHECGCGSNEEESNPEMKSFSFSMDKEMYDEVIEAAKANNMAFEEFIYNCIEVGLAITAGDLALIDTDQLEEGEEDDEEDEEA